MIVVFLFSNRPCLEYVTEAGLVLKFTRIHFFKTNVEGCLPIYVMQDWNLKRGRFTVQNCQIYLGFLLSNIEQVFNREVSMRRVLLRLAISLQTFRGGQVVENTTTIWKDVEAKLDLLLGIN